VALLAVCGVLVLASAPVAMVHALLWLALIAAVVWLVRMVAGQGSARARWAAGPVAAPPVTGAVSAESVRLLAELDQAQAEIARLRGCQIAQEAPEARTLPDTPPVPRSAAERLLAAPRSGVRPLYPRDLP
jgi:hypothetical protein